MTIASLEGGQPLGVTRGNFSDVSGSVLVVFHLAPNLPIYGCVPPVSPRETDEESAFGGGLASVSCAPAWEGGEFSLPFLRHGVCDTEHTQPCNLKRFNG